MSKKSVVLVVALAIISAMMASAITIYFARGLFTPQGPEQSGLSVSSLFGTGEEEVKDAEVHFVDIKNVVINLSDTGRAKHYLLLDLALATEDKEAVKRIDSSVALVKSATVNLLTNTDYDELSTMSVTDLRSRLFEEYRKEYAALKMSVPFTDVMISKMVFQ